MKFKQGDLIKICWTDAGGLGGWNHIDEFTPPRIVTVGHYLKEDRDGIYYAEGIDGQDYKKVLGLGFVPQGCVKHIRKLK